MISYKIAESCVKQMMFLLLTNSINLDQETDQYISDNVKNFDDLLITHTKTLQNWLNDNTDLCREYKNGDFNQKFELMILFMEPIEEMFPIVDAMSVEFSDMITNCMDEFLNSIV